MYETFPFELTIAAEKLTAHMEFLWSCRIVRQYTYLLFKYLLYV